MPRTGAIRFRCGNPRLFQSPDGSRLLIACGAIERYFTEWGGDAVVTDRDDLRNFEDFPLEDHYLTAFPGTPLPPQEHGREAVFAAKGTRIIAGGSTGPLVLLDVEGTRIAELDKRNRFAFPAAVSTTGIVAREDSGASDRKGDRIRFWDVRDGAELGRIEGSDGWQLRAAPFWSEDGATLFAPRERNGTMLLDQFRAP